MGNLKVFNFDSNGFNAPAYSCNWPGDNSGSYYSMDAIDNLLQSNLEKPPCRFCAEWESAGYYFCAECGRYLIL